VKQILLKTPTRFALFLLFCSLQCRAQNPSSISGKITLTKDWHPVLYLVKPNKFMDIAASFGGLVIDSAKIADDGRFSFQTKNNDTSAVLYQICLQKKGSRYPTKLLDDSPFLANYMLFVLKKEEKIQLFAQSDSFEVTFSILNPSFENQQLLQLRDLRFQAYQLYLLPIENQTVTEENLLEHETTLQFFRQHFINFADSSAFLLPALVAARWVSTSGDYERNPEILYQLYQKWQQKQPQNPWVAQLGKVANPEKLPVFAGSFIPNESLPMLAGDTLLLHSMLGSKLTILDIWAAWCGPCRSENREILQPLWSNYKEKGFQIVGYSIDSDAVTWKAAILKDQANWQHASHLMGDIAPFLGVLRISTIPANYILDEKGFILAKNLHGEFLKAFVENYFKYH
jgi:thiol-disulfide isomerase/thioredoxin